MQETAALAMVAEDELEGFISSLSLSPRGINHHPNVQPRDVPLSEDAAWADSLLIEGPEISENCWSSWNSLQDALSETLSGKHASLLAMQDNGPPVDDSWISSSHKSLASPESPSTRLDDTLLDIEEANDGSEGLVNYENRDFLWSKRKLKNVFRPTYNEDLRPSGTSYKEEEPFLSSLVADQPPEEIFQVWDLGVPAEEDEWIKQLNEALVESSSEPSPLASASTVLKDLTDIRMDDIISGMEDLSLNRLL